MLLSGHRHGNVPIHWKGRCGQHVTLFFWRQVTHVTCPRATFQERLAGSVRAANDRLVSPRVGYGTGQTAIAGLALCFRRRVRVWLSASDVLCPRSPRAVGFRWKPVVGAKLAARKMKGGDKLDDFITLEEQELVCHGVRS